MADARWYAENRQRGAEKRRLDVLRFYGVVGERAGYGICCIRAEMKKVEKGISTQSRSPKDREMRLHGTLLSENLIVFPKGLCV
jgi:hypothetical protein